MPPSLAAAAPTQTHNRLHPPAPTSAIRNAPRVCPPSKNRSSASSAASSPAAFLASRRCQSCATAATSGAAPAAPAAAWAARSQAACRPSTWSRPRGRREMLESTAVPVRRYPPGSCSTASPIDPACGAAPTPPTSATGCPSTLVAASSRAAAAERGTSTPLSSGGAGVAQASTCCTQAGGGAVGARARAGCGAAAAGAAAGAGAAGCGRRACGGGAAAAAPVACKLCSIT